MARLPADSSLYEPTLRQMIDVHGPEAWEEDVSYESMEAAVSRTGPPIPMVVLAADIRGSTQLMKEAIDLHVFAEIIGSCFTESMRFIRGMSHGWFDKFTGDGFIAYWPCGEESVSYRDALSEALLAADGFVLAFQYELDALRKNSRNFPASAGMSCGLDAGDAYFAVIAGDLTIVGHPVVGAVRMVAAAEPGEIICNTAIGEHLLAEPLAFDYNFEVARARRAARETKEYKPQEVYVVEIVQEEP